MILLENVNSRFMKDLAIKIYLLVFFIWLLNNNNNDNNNNNNNNNKNNKMEYNATKVIEKYLKPLAKIEFAITNFSRFNKEFN